MRNAVRSVLCLLAALLAFAPLASFAQTATFNLPAQPLAESLKALGAQANLNVMVSPALVDGKQAPALKAKLSVSDALARLLNGTGLEYHFVNDQTVVIREKGGAAVATKDPPSGQVTNANTQDATKVAGKKSSQDFRVAQVDQGQTSSPSTVEKPDEQASKKKRDQLEEIIVTGSRIPRAAAEAAQEVKVYTRAQIDQSGQTNIADFLNTLPDVSIANTGNYLQAGNGTGSTVQLHGLPIGTTLVLLDGRRVETSGSQQFSNFFDLNNIPLAAVGRVEVVSEGSSAIYGSDAVAGVVNIILKNNFDGLAFDAKYGGASGEHELEGSLAWGKKWDRGSLTVVTSAEYQSDLHASQRALTASNDFTAYGGPNNNVSTCPLGNVFSVDGTNLPGLNAPYAAVPPGFRGTPSIQEFVGTAGKLNQCGLLAGTDFIPTTHRQAVVVSGHFDLTPSLQLFGQLLYSHVLVEVDLGLQTDIFGTPGSQSFTASASNPFNPFGQAVGISEQIPPEYVNSQTTDFVRPVVGVRGSFSSDWQWEVSAWDSQDRSTGNSEHLNDAAVQVALNSSNPATALNPFVAGAPGSAQLLQSVSYQQSSVLKGQILAATGFVRGPLVQLPAGPLNVVLGGEYTHHTLESDIAMTPSFPAFQATYHRTSYAAFAETRIPVLPGHYESADAAALVVTVAGRYDHYDDFGSKTTPQFGVEWRPAASLLLRGSYSRAFVAPSLYEINLPSTTLQTTVLDPALGNQAESVLATQGGNPNLRPETGHSRTFGIVYSSRLVPDLQLSVTRWGVEESNNIQFLDLATLVNNSALFPGAVVRATNCGAPVCPIVQLNDLYVNFGTIDVAGFDYRVNYKYQSHAGVFTPSLAVTQTDRYRVSLTPSAPAIDANSRAQDTGDWAPRWKGTVSLGWALGPFSAAIAGRYVGRYQDYDSTNEIGNFWLCDANIRWALGDSIGDGRRWLKGTYVTVGGVNVLNKLPQFSNYFNGLVGYDPTQADLRGRFLYLQIGARL
jgi:iron complex outermembrane receptor protein